jgi:hypothetical protein
MTGGISLEEVALRQVRAGKLLVQTRCSLISAGTERKLLQFGRAGWLAKARQQPEKVKQVLDKVRTTLTRRLRACLPTGNRSGSSPART